MFADDSVTRFQMDPNVIMSNQPECYWEGQCEFIILPLTFDEE